MAIDVSVEYYGGFLPNIILRFFYVGITYDTSEDQPGKSANPARGQLNRENDYFPVPVRA